MKKWLLSLLMVLATATATAQREQDFALRYMHLYGENSSLACKTVSPQMIARMMQLTEDSATAFRQVLSQLKSIRVVQNENPAETVTLYDKAEELAKANKRRYTLYARTEDRSIYLRKRGKLIVELVLLTRVEDEKFSIVNLTGNMTGDFIRELMKI